MVVLINGKKKIRKLKVEIQEKHGMRKEQYQEKKKTSISSLMISKLLHMKF
jgi:hypothetical protein